MSKSPFSRLRKPFSSRRSTGRRPLAHRNMAFESLEPRQMLSVTALSDFSVSTNTGEKPQSKVWEYNDQWYSVMADSDGTWVWKLQGADWQHELQLSQNNNFNADVKQVGDMAQVLLFDGQNSKLATIQYDTGVNDYRMWSLRPSLVDVTLSSGVETATLDMDSTGRLWIASDVKTTIEVRYADFSSQYTNWSGPITIASGINKDDISVITAMGGNKIGVMWSNQSSDRFGFRVHVDGAAATSWSADEIPASQSALSKGGGMADDHINLAVASNGTVYAAVKTSYDSSGYPKIALLVRRPSGVWDNLYNVDSSGTRPIVILNEAAGKLIVAYTSSESGGKIYYKESSLNAISFGDRQTLISGSVNNVTSIKGNFTDDVVLMASSGGKVSSVIFRFDGPVVNLPPTVNAGADRTIQVGTTLTLNGTVTDDGLLNLSPTSQWTKVSGPGSVTFGDDTEIDTTVTFSQVGTYVLKLSANDGEFSASDTVTIVVEEAPPPAPNQAPVVNAGPDQNITLPELANLSGAVTDTDGPLATPVVSWSLVSGPGSVSFGNAASTNTTASFSAAGTYVLRLTASDGQLQSFSDITITVSPEPTTTSSGGSTAGSRLRGYRGR
jgi:K319L-like, PKD domain